MKTSNTNTSTQPAQIAAFRSLPFDALTDLCDDPVRNETGQEVQAVLTPLSAGFALSARDGGVTYSILDDNGQPMVFRSVDQALDALADVPFLLPEVVIDTIRWGLTH